MGLAQQLLGALGGWVSAGPRRGLSWGCGLGMEQPHGPGASGQRASVNSGADDLLPILSFVVLRSGLPQLVSECAALEEFIHEG